MVALMAALMIAVAATPAAATSPIREFDLVTVERLGLEIARQDTAAWVATDALGARISTLHKEGGLGFLVSPLRAGEPPRVRFLRGPEDAPQVAYDVTVQGRSGSVTTPADRSLTPDEAAAFRAVRTALAAHGPVCAAQVNTAVAKDPEGDGWLVWLLNPMPAAGAIPIGGHARFTISADGREVKRRDALSLSCLVLPAPEQGKDAQMAFTTHLVSDSPVETQVFIQLQSRRPLAIGTRDRRLWMIDGGHIKRMGLIPER